MVPNRPRIGLSVAMPTLGRWSGLWHSDADWERETYCSPREHAEATAPPRSRAFGVGTLVMCAGSSPARSRTTESGRHVSAGAAIDRRLFEDRLADDWRVPSRRLREVPRVSDRHASRRRGASRCRVAFACGRRPYGRAGGHRFARPARFFGRQRTPGTLVTRCVRAHPLLQDGTIRASRLGRLLAHSTIELQRDSPAFHWLVFVGRYSSTPRSNPRCGRVIQPVTRCWGGSSRRTPGAPGIFRVDMARGVREETSCIGRVAAELPGLVITGWRAAETGRRVIRVPISRLAHSSTCNGQVAVEGLQAKARATIAVGACAPSRSRSLSRIGPSLLMESRADAATERMRPSSKPGWSRSDKATSPPGDSISSGTP